MMKKEKRQLYQCFNAKVKGDLIRCSKGHSIGKQGADKIKIQRLRRGDPLKLPVCQECKDYDEMGGRVEPDDRGWSNDDQSSKEIKDDFGFLVEQR